jgi:ankyrin repeat protein
MIMATITGDTRAVTMMLEEDIGLVNGRGANECTPLHVAVKSLSEYSFVLSSLQKAFGYAPVQRRSLAMVRLLLDHGATPDLKVDGRTPLYWTADLKVSCF